MFLPSQRTPPFQMTTQAGFLVPDGLPGPVGERYRKNNIVVASLPTVLNLSAGADLQPFYVTAGVSGLLGFVMLVAADAMARAGGARRKTRAASCCRQLKRAYLFFEAPQISIKDICVAPIPHQAPIGKSGTAAIAARRDVARLACRQRRMVRSTFDRGNADQS